MIIISQYISEFNKKHLFYLMIDIIKIHCRKHLFIERRLHICYI